MSTIVTVYSTGPECQKCRGTKYLLKKHGVEFVEKPVTEEVIASAEELGLDLIAPIVCVSKDGEETYWSDYRPDRIKALVA